MRGEARAWADRQLALDELGRSAASARSGRSRGGFFGFSFLAFFGLGSETVPSRSIFGARLRRRVPQYGHSVMYGLTSEPQFLHTTKRSGELAIYRR